MKYFGKKEDIGGIAAREKNGPLWYFLPENDGSFLSPYADFISRLYFPLMNRHGMKCSITPEMKGDIASSFPHYLTAATVTEELHRNVSGRNFWVTVQDQKPWSAAGNSAFQKAEKWTGLGDESEIEGRIGAFISRRKNASLGLKSEITVFVPDTDDFVELMKVSITNDSEIPITFSPVSATPIFGRHPDNFRDHRQVTTMFQKVFLDEHGVRVKPTIVHDEHGHSVNTVQYAVLGFEGGGEKPLEIWAAMSHFIGEGGSLDNPEAVYKNLSAPAYAPGDADGMEAIGAMKYPMKTIGPGEVAEYVIIHGITGNEEDIAAWKEKFGSVSMFDSHLETTLQHWQGITSAVSFETGNPDFDNWTKWITFQLKCRQIFGNSYLPDFGYGRGGRGWRDLWQDLLSIFLIDPDSAREEILNNFKGIRIDGSNATIIGTKPGEFIADRNNVSRTWCDHGSWPVLVLDFYIHQTGDFGILLEPLTYWKDKHVFRNREIDENWDPEQGNLQRDIKGNSYSGSIFEHILIQQLSAFFNVGEHNNILLEGGDWNDTLDMAREKGESVCFHNFYAHNLEILARLLKVLQQNGFQHITLFKELELLVDRTSGSDPVNYQSPEAKRECLNRYFMKVRHTLSGESKAFDISDLVRDLSEKAIHMTEHIREKEWISTKKGHQFFNGHYSNRGERIHGDHPLGIRMDLTSQVMPIMFNVADNNQIEAIWKSAGELLKDRDSDGLRLCTNFHELDLSIGRVTGFVFGNKEHGSKWMQQNIMLAYGLYRRGFIKEGHDVLRQIYRLAMDSATSLIFPGIPSYFNNQDRGAYAYLTGSSSWLLLTYLTQVFGVRGEAGNLAIQPALAVEQFNRSGVAKVNFHFAGRKLRVIFNNPEFLDAGNYKISTVLINGLPYETKQVSKTGIIIRRSEIEKLSDRDRSIIEIDLTNMGA